MSARARQLVTGPLACVVLLVALPAAASATDATIKGTVAGPGLPDSGEGIAGVRAINAETGAVVGADYTSGGRDKWDVQVSPGPYVLGASTVPFEGGKLVDRLVAFAAARAGSTETVKLRLKPKPRHHHAVSRRLAARLGDVDVDYPAIWVHEFGVESSDPDLGVMGKGMAAMLITDLVSGFSQRDCEAVVVEREHIQDVIKEQKLQQLPGFDPGTRVRKGQLIRDNASVTGTITEAGGQVTITAQYTDSRTGRTRGVSVQGGAGESIFALEQELAKKLLDAICDKLPGAYDGTFQGTSVDPEMTVTFSGSVTYERLRPPDQRGTDCESVETACYTNTGGSITWQVGTTPGAQCTYHAGPSTVAIPADYGFISLDATGGDSPGYAGSLGQPDDNVTGTVACPSQPVRSANFHLMGCCFATDAGIPWGEFAQAGGFLLQGSASHNGITGSWDLTGR